MAYMHRQHSRFLVYRSADVILLCFGIDSPESFKNASGKVSAGYSHLFCGKLSTELSSPLLKWREEVQAACKSDVPLFLVGCRSDIRRGWGRCLISPYDAEIMASTIGARDYYECSAATSNGMDLLMDAVAEASLERE
jgi:GTPase SAR1 family protein